MLTRLEIDNFRCFDNFVFEPGPKQLILGENGVGKSSLFDALLFVRQFVARGDKLDGTLLTQRTRWKNSPSIKFGLDVALNSDRFRYCLELEPSQDRSSMQVKLEEVLYNDRRVLSFRDGSAHLLTEVSEPRSLPVDDRRSALGFLGVDETLAPLQRWFARLYFFRLNPFGMSWLAEGEDFAPNADLSNFTAWYRHLLQTFPQSAQGFREDLKKVFGKPFELSLEPVHTGRVLVAKLAGHGEAITFRELSDGQRCMICLYAILHFCIANGQTVFLDEPDNFLSLREIQPWLMAVEDMIHEQQGQVVLISHHPELINQWAPDCGVQFGRESNGAARVALFQSDDNSILTPAELVARGWEGG